MGADQPPEEPEAEEQDLTEEETLRARNARNVRSWRQKNPTRADALRRDQRIRDRALRELGRRHPTELNELIARIKRAEITRGRNGE